MAVQEKVEARFDVRGGRQFASTLGSLGASLKAVGGSISRVTNLINPFNVAIAGIGTGVALHGIASIGSQFEEMRIGMAQTLRFMGASGGTFADSMQQAEGVIDRVYAAAAALPGEAEDYANALRLAGTNVNRALGDFDQSFELIKDMTAIGASMGRSSQETAQFLNRALDTQRGMLEQGSDYTVELVNAMRNLPGQANLTVQAFNKLDLEERVRLLNSANGLTAQYNDMIEASSSTWSAVSGAAATTFRTVARMATGPLFSTMTTQLGRMNELFVDANGEMTRFGRATAFVGQTIFGTIGKAFEHVVGLVEYLSNNMDSILRGIGDVVAPAFGGIAGGVSAGSGSAATASGMESFGAAFDTVFDTITAAGEPLVQMLTDFMGIVGPTIQFFGSMAEVVANIAHAVLPPFLEAMQAVLEPIWMVISGFIEITNAIIQRVAPVFERISEALGGLFRAVGRFLAPIIRILGNIFLHMYDLLADTLVPVFEFLGDTIGWLIEKITEFIDWLGSLLEDAAEELGIDVSEDAEDERADTAAMRRSLDEFLAGLEGEAEEEQAIAAATQRAVQRPTPRARGGGRTVQDFRYSRFQIEQKFEEGFDPDRIAVAFAQDVGSLAENRLQSGFEPVFGLR